MCPRDDGKTTFKYPDDRLPPLRDMITEERMRSPNMLDHDNDACLFVIINGNVTDVTIGCGTGILSFLRDDDIGDESMKWAYYNYINKSGVFSAPGDSRAIIVDGLGRIGGLFVGGTGKTETSDVNYEKETEIGRPSPVSLRRSGSECFAPASFLYMPLLSFPALPVSLIGLESCFEPFYLTTPPHSLACIPLLFFLFLLPMSFIRLESPRHYYLVLLVC